MLYDKKWDEKLPVDNFLSAKELGINEKDHQTLIKLLGMFERGEITEKLFTMKVIGNPNCGSPGCLIGWGRTFNPDFTVHPHPLPLPFLILFSSEWAGATTAQAAVALRNYLTTGHSKWEEIIHVV